MNLTLPVTGLRGIGDSRRDALAKLGINTVGDLLTFLPRAYQNRGNVRTLAEIRERLSAGENTPFSSVAEVLTKPEVRSVPGKGRGKTIVSVLVGDGTDTCQMTWFNQPYIADSIIPGDTYRFYGRYSFFGRGITASSPIAEKCSDDAELDSIVPVYPLVSGITQRLMYSLTSRALSMCLPEITDWIPADTLERLALPTYSYAIRMIHRPVNTAAVENAKRRLTFDELALLFFSSSLDNSQAKRGTGIVINTPMKEFAAALPFEMTGAQKRSVKEILTDMKSGNVMNRIVTGDVGSGKTAVCEAAVFAACRAGYRCAVMAPTEILANQHYADFSRLLEPLGIKTALLTGSTKKNERANILRSLRDECSPDEKTDVIIGTHALLTEDVTIDSLALAVIDEQHRFGVLQRAALFDKAENVHCLVMSATPIPRTLTLAVYGGIDVSRIDELPAGRKKVDTFVVNESYRERLNAFIIKQKNEGHQTYVVCPAVEDAQTDDSEEMSDFELTAENPAENIKAAESFAEYLRDTLPELKIALVHGKMRPKAKEEVMNAFAKGETDVLVSTTVIEVGVNVPNATLMIVENAERFGLSQLHQLRGRVGRGDSKSYFILVAGGNNKEDNERLKIIKGTSDGFEVAERDLELRGPGDFFGDGGLIRQHGQMSMKLAAQCSSKPLIEAASEWVKSILSDDPDLTKDENRAIKEKLDSVGTVSERTIN